MHFTAETLWQQSAAPATLLRVGENLFFGDRLKSEGTFEIA
jgi:hypothetical protein